MPRRSRQAGSKGAAAVGKLRAYSEPFVLARRSLRMADNEARAEKVTKTVLSELAT